MAFERLALDAHPVSHTIARLCFIRERGNYLQSGRVAASDLLDLFAILVSKGHIAGTPAIQQQGYFATVELAQSNLMENIEKKVRSVFPAQQGR